MTTTTIITNTTKCEAIENLNVLLAGFHEIVMSDMVGKQLATPLAVTFGQEELVYVERINPGLANILQDVAKPREQVTKKFVEAVRRLTHHFLADAIRAEKVVQANAQRETDRARAEQVVQGNAQKEELRKEEDRARAEQIVQGNARKEQLRGELERLGLREVDGNSSIKTLEEHLATDRVVKLSQCRKLAEVANEHAGKLGEASIKAGVENNTQTETLIARWVELDKIERELRAQATEKRGNEERVERTRAQALAKHERANKKGEIRCECLRRGLDPKRYIEQFNRTGKMPHFDRKPWEKLPPTSKIEALAAEAASRRAAAQVSDPEEDEEAATDAA